MTLSGLEVLLLRRRFFLNVLESLKITLCRIILLSGLRYLKHGVLFRLPSLSPLLFEQLLHLFILLLDQRCELCLGFHLRLLLVFLEDFVDHVLCGQNWHVVSMSDRNDLLH